MMIHRSSSIVCLCLFLSSFLPLVHCQFGAHPFGDGPFEGGFGRRPIGNGFPGPGSLSDIVPDRFLQPFKPLHDPDSSGNTMGRPQQRPGNPEVDAGQVEDSGPPRAGEEGKQPMRPEIRPSTALPSVTKAPAKDDSSDSEATMAAPSKPPGSFMQAPAAAIPSPGPPTFEGPARDADTIDGTPTALLIAPSSMVAPSGRPTSAINSVVNSLPTASTTSTTTISTTILVTPSPISTGSPNADATETQSPSASQALNIAPVSTSTGSKMSAAARAGLGVGITFGIVAVASIVGLFLWRRRRNRLQREARNSRSGALGGFFTLKRWKTNKSDSEWEIGDAEKIKIFSGASQRTVSRSDSRSTGPTRDGDGRNGSSIDARSRPALQIVKVGMRLPDRPNPALTSNPPVPSPSQFPTPPSSRGTLGPEKQTSSWPLPDRL